MGASIFDVTLKYDEMALDYVRQHPDCRYIFLSSGAAYDSKEEHSVLGGLGSIIAEIASEFAPVRILRVGVQDRFSQHCGSYEY